MENYQTEANRNSDLKKKKERKKENGIGMDTCYVKEEEQ
jgi:hypothetical protein